MASNHHSFEDFATAVAWEAGKLLVMERVKVAPPKAMEMRIRVKYTSVYHIELLLLPKAHLLQVNTLLFILAVFPKSSPLLGLDKICILSCVIPTGLGSPLNVAKRKIILSCLLASLLLKVEKFLRCQSIGVESVDLKPKRFDEVYNVHTAKEKTKTSTSAEAPDRTNCR